MEHPQTQHTYLELIRALLHCPKGEELSVLHQNADLITPELLQIMQEVATALAMEGHDSSARFLRHWEAQLAHSLSHRIQPEQTSERTEAYLQLSRALMNCTPGSEPQLLAQHADLVDDGLVKTLEQVATQAALQGDQKTARYLHHWAEELHHSPPQPPVHSHETVLQEPTSRPSPPDQHWLRDLETLLSQLHPASPAPNRSTPSSEEHHAPSTSARPSHTDQEIEIAKALFRLGSILKSRLQPHNPLWYMEVLERAAAQGWVLSTDEVEQLLGIKPRHPVGKHSFEWGCWIFEKAGRIGSQLAWRVVKAEGESLVSDTDPILSKSNHSDL